MSQSKISNKCLPEFDIFTEWYMYFLSLHKTFIYGKFILSYDKLKTQWNKSLLDPLLQKLTHNDHFLYHTTNRRIQLYTTCRNLHINNYRIQVKISWKTIQSSLTRLFVYYSKSSQKLQANNFGNVSCEPGGICVMYWVWWMSKSMNCHMWDSCVASITWYSQLCRTAMSISWWIWWITVDNHEANINNSNKQKDESSVLYNR